MTYSNLCYLAAKEGVSFFIEPGNNPDTITLTVSRGDISLSETVYWPMVNPASIVNLLYLEIMKKEAEEDQRSESQ